MSSAIAREGTAGPARLLLAGLLTLVLAVVLTATATPAAAGPNQGWDDCLTGYNYADPATDYLFAATDANDLSCTWMTAEIRNGGSVVGFGFSGARCFGTLLSSAQATTYVTTSTTLPSGSWSQPCSGHYASPAPGHRFNGWGALEYLW